LRSLTAKDASAGGKTSGTVFQVFIPDDPGLAAESKLTAAAQA